jgi:DNA mismatch repair protein MutS2
VDSHALAVLEFPVILEQLVAATETEPGAELARGLLPSVEPDEVARRQALTAEAVALFDAAAEPSLAGVEDVRAAVDRAARGGVLEPDRLHAVAQAVRVAVDARHALDAAEPEPLLREAAAVIEPGLTALAESIERCVDDEGTGLRDAASPALRRLRGELTTGRRRARDQLLRMTGSPDLRHALQETFVTERAGRPVLAVKASARSEVPGVVHASSSSGQTLFVEPFAVVELSNRLAETEGAEREEVDRILRELSALVAARAEAVTALVEAVAELDLALARGSLSRRWRGAAIEPGNCVRLVGARHPLLDPATVVPIDLDLGDLRTLVVSGPNTGGKTVALKTLGLATLLHQSGLRPPAAEAALPVFDEVLADIGDEQSIAMSLSTFSAHLGNIVRILDAATGRSLVLLDEITAGTDPVEGAALAQALLERLSRQARLTVVTTHYPELKEWASATRGAANAATALDPETAAPLYRLALGRSGTSHALRTAERLGLDPAVVDAARARVEPARLRTAELLAEAEAAESRATGERDAARRRRAEAEAAAARAIEREAELTAEIESVRASAERERASAFAAAERELADARAELEALRKEIRAARRRERERRAAAGDTAPERERDRRLGAASGRAARAERALRAFRTPEQTAPLAAGDPVEAADTGVQGTIASIEGDTAEVSGPHGVRLKIPLAQLRPSDRPPPAPREPAVRVLASAADRASDELDVRGMRAQEAREAVRSFVDDAALAGLSTVRVVHGRGTGALRAAVREELNAHALVNGHKADSADGASIASLR